MEYKYHLNWEDHDWEKLNLVSKSCPQGLYDEYGCKCGAWAHRYGVGDLVSHKNFRPCKTKIEPTIEGYTIGVKQSSQIGTLFQHLDLNLIRYMNLVRVLIQIIWMIYGSCLRLEMSLLDYSAESID